MFDSYHVVRHDGGRRTLLNVAFTTLEDAQNHCASMNWQNSQYGVIYTTFAKKIDDSFPAFERNEFSLRLVYRDAGYLAWC